MQVEGVEGGGDVFSLPGQLLKVKTAALLLVQKLKSLLPQVLHLDNVFITNFIKKLPL